jgi:hypothetical protein
LRPPIKFVYGNCVFANGLDDAWATFVLEPTTYAWLTVAERRRHMHALVAALTALQADFQISRVSSAWPVDGYVRSIEGELAQASARGDVRAAMGESYVAEHRRHLQGAAPVQAWVLLAVSLSEPQRDVAAFLSEAAAEHPREWWRRLVSSLSARDLRVVSVRELERLRVRAERLHACLTDFLPARPARVVELQWLIRRAFCRGLGEPVVDGLHEPAALLFEANGEAVLAPLEADVMRWGSLVPFRWFLSRLETWLYGWDSRQSVMPGHRRSRASRRRSVPCFGPRNPKKTRLRGSLKKPSARHRSRPILVVQGGVQVGGWLEVQEHQEPAHRPLRQPRHQEPDEPTRAPGGSSSPSASPSSGTGQLLDAHEGGGLVGVVRVASLELVPEDALEARPVGARLRGPLCGQLGLRDDD